MKILRYDGFVMEKKTAKVEDTLFHAKNGGIRIDTDKLSHYLSFYPKTHELAKDQNPDDPNSKWNYELAFTMSGEINPNLKNKLKKLKEEHMQYVSDAFVDTKNNYVVIKFKDNLKVEVD